MGAFYLTTPIYYVNARPHIGHAYTTFAADAIARWRRMRGDDVVFLTGTDENAQKNAEAAATRLGKSVDAVTRTEVQAYVDAMSAVWQQTWDTLGIRYDRFIRTTEPAHVRGVERFIATVRERNPDDIYRGTYRGWYCVGCETFVTEQDAGCGKQGAGESTPRCSIHQQALRRVEEENYFFRLSAYRDALIHHIDRNPAFVQPASRRNEILAYIDAHLADISISRPMRNWGIPFPGDSTQAVYVWFDALVNYLTGVGYGTDDAQFAVHWPAQLHLVGKDIVKFHGALWPAMLMSAGLELPERICVHGHFTIKGEKMSKTRGNVVDPVEVAQRYGIDALRYFLLREIPFGEDGDYTETKFRDRYIADLQHGVGNFAARTIVMVHRYAGGRIHTADSASRIHRAWEQYAIAMDAFALHDALGVIGEVVRAGDHAIEEERPWELAKLGERERLQRCLGNLTETLRHVGLMLAPFLPETADRILGALNQDHWRRERLADLQQWGCLQEGTAIGELAHLFPALETSL